MNKNSDKILKWALINFGVLFAYVLGHEFEELTLILYIGTVLLWITAVVGLFVNTDYFVNIIVEKVPNWEPSAPFIVDISYDLLMTIIIFHYGDYNLSVIYFIHIITTNLMKIRIQNIQAETRNKSDLDGN